MVLTGAGLGITFPLYIIAVQNAFDRSQLGVVTAALQFFRGIGGTIGATAFGAVMTTRFKDQIESLVKRMPESARSKIPAEQLAEIVQNPQSLASGLGDELTLPPEILPLMQEALSNSITVLFVIGLIVLGVALIVNVWLPESILKTTWDDGEPAGESTS
jgi:hypothetical protein